MRFPIVLASALVAISGQAFAAKGDANCAVTHKDCYPACVKHTADGSDCAKIQTVCRQVCGPEPERPAYDEESKIVPMPALPPQGKTVSAEQP